MCTFYLLFMTKICGYLKFLIYIFFSCPIPSHFSHYSFSSWDERLDYIINFQAKTDFSDNIAARFSFLFLSYGV